ncbi:hypothetical protein D3C84_258150 [compost metagenome]
MLADDVGRRAHLVVVQFVVRRDQVGVLVHHAVEGVGAHHQWLGRPLLVDHRPRIFPERNHPCLREVIADLVEHGVELDIGAFVDTRPVGRVRRRTAERHAVDALATVEQAGTGAAGQAFLPVIHAGLEERRPSHRRRAVGAEVARLHNATRQHRVAWVIRLGVEQHRRLFDIVALFRQVHRFGPGHALGQVQGTGDDFRLATCSHAIQGMARQAAVPASHLVRVQVRPQGLAGVFQGLRLGRVEHVQRWRWRPLADGAFHATDPEWVTRVFQGAIGVAVGFAAVDQGEGPNRFQFMAVGMVISLFVLVLFLAIVSRWPLTELGHHFDLARHRRHGLAWQWHYRRNRRTGDDLAIGQGPCTLGRLATAQGERGGMEAVLALLGNLQAGALLEHIVHPPHGPHALGKVRVEVAVVDRIAGYPVAVARTAVGDFIGVARTRTDALGIHIVGVIVIGVEQPLVAVQVEDVLLVAVVAVAELDEVPDIAVVDVRRLGRVQRHRRLDPDRVGRWHLPRRQAFQADVGRHVHQHGDVADGMGTEEELFIGAGQAVMHRAHAQAVGDDLGADAARAVVDHE